MRKYQWILCGLFVLLAVALMFLLAGKQDKKMENGSFVLERTWNGEGLY